MALSRSSLRFLKALQSCEDVLQRIILSQGTQSAEPAQPVCTVDNVLPFLSDATALSGKTKGWTFEDTSSPRIEYRNTFSFKYFAHFCTPPLQKQNWLSSRKAFSQRQPSTFRFPAAIATSALRSSSARAPFSFGKLRTAQFFR